MTDPKDRLIRCFTAAFPHLSHEETIHASPNSVARWDSLATVTLFALVEEEFGLNLSIDQLDETEEPISFEWLLGNLVAPTSGEQQTWDTCYGDRRRTYER